MPYDFFNSHRLRIGPNGDGGYVLLNDGLEDIDVLYSYGVNDNSNFELMFCEKFNAIARLYDHTVDAPPLNKECFSFFKEGVGPKKTSNLNTIENYITRSANRKRFPLFRLTKNFTIYLHMDQNQVHYQSQKRPPTKPLDLHNDFQLNNPNENALPLDLFGQKKH